MIGALVRPLGTTLLELVAAMAVTSIVLLTASITVEQVTTTRARLDRALVTQREESVGERVLASQLWNGLSAELPLTGDEHALQMGTRCLDGSGWHRPCVVDLLVRRLADGSEQLVLYQRDTRASTPVRSGPDLRLTYLASSEDGGHWMDRWDLLQTRPIAVGIVAGTDTVIYRSGRPGDS